MTTAVTAQRLAIALSAALALAACSGQGGAHAADADTPQASSSAGLPNGRIAVGEQLANAKGKATGQSCIDCHGPDGNAPIDSTYPKLGGQYADYLEHSLQGYRDGRREHALMSSEAAGLTDQQIADIYAFLQALPGKLDPKDFPLLKDF